jgi:predicted nucleic acid-binding protein
LSAVHFNNDINFLIRIIDTNIVIATLVSRTVLAFAAKKQEKYKKYHPKYTMAEVRSSLIAL